MSWVGIVIKAMRLLRNIPIIYMERPQCDCPSYLCCHSDICAYMHACVCACVRACIMYVCMYVYMCVRGGGGVVIRFI